MRLAAGTILAALALGGLGCEGDSEPTELETREEIAMTINDVRDALAAGDGETLCAKLTERGRRVMLRVGERAEPSFEAETCEQAVESLAASFTDRQMRAAVGTADYTAADVDVDPTDEPGSLDGRTDAVPEGGPRSVEVPCKRGDGNSYFAEREGEEWKLIVPFCTGR